MRTIANLLAKLHFRFLGILLAVILGGLVWAITKLFPTVDRQTVAIIGAFALAGLFAFSVGGRRGAQNPNANRRSVDQVQGANSIVNSETGSVGELASEHPQTIGHETQQFR